MRTLSLILGCREFFESYLAIFQQDAKFDSASHDVAEYIMLCILRTMCSESSQLYSICLQKKIIDTLIKGIQEKDNPTVVKLWFIFLRPQRNFLCGFSFVF